MNLSILRSSYLVIQYRIGSFLGSLLAHVRVLGHAELGGCYLQDLICGQVLHTLVQGHFNGGSNARGNTLGSGTHVGQLLHLAYVDFQITRTLVNSHTAVIEQQKRISEMHRSCCQHEYLNSVPTFQATYIIPL